MMTTIETVYWLPYCSTCLKAQAYLRDELGLSIKQYVNIKEEQVSKATIKKLAEAVGGVEKLFSKRAMKYRSMGLHERDLSEAEMLDLMHEEYTFIKRPVVVSDTGVTLAGFSKKQYDAHFKRSPVS